MPFLMSILDSWNHLNGNQNYKTERCEEINLSGSVSHKKTDKKPNHNPKLWHETKLVCAKSREINSRKKTNLEPRLKHTAVYRKASCE